MIILGQAERVAKLGQAERVAKLGQGERQGDHVFPLYMNLENLFYEEICYHCYPQLVAAILSVSYERVWGSSR